jgi:hypothetical protein
MGPGNAGSVHINSQRVHSLALDCTYSIPVFTDFTCRPALFGLVTPGAAVTSFGHFQQAAPKAPIYVSVFNSSQKKTPRDQ